jgi:capreomycidine synthase
MKLPKASLEHWMRDYYFDAKYDLGSSGVYSYSFGELRQILDISTEELDQVSFDDSLTRGSDGLRQAIADRYGDGNREHVMTSNGSNEMLYHILTTMLEKDDEVILLDTIYHALSSVPIAKGCDIKLWSMSPASDFRVNLDELRQLITPNTKLVAVNFPHNPTGVTITQKEQDELIEIVSSVGAYLVWDAAFDELTTEKPLKNPFLSYDKAISVGTLSKCYGLPGLRVGWCFASEKVILECVQLRDYTTLYISPLIELIAQKAIEQTDTLINSRMREISVNKKHLETWVERHKDKIQWSKPSAGVTSLIKFKGVENVDDFCKTLTEKYGVMLVPGSCFGHDDYIRLGFGERIEDFKTGLNLLSKYVFDEEFL